MEIISEANELIYFLRSAACGAAMTVIYDFFRAKRHSKKVKNLVIYIEDIIWLCAVGFLIYILAFRENAGMFRWYSVMGMALGGLCYKLLLGDRLTRVFEKLYVLFVGVLCFLVKILTAPFKLLCSLIKKPVSVVIWHSREGSGEIMDLLRSIKRLALKRLGNKNVKQND